MIKYQRSPIWLKQPNKSHSATWTWPKFLEKKLKNASTTRSTRIDTNSSSSSIWISISDSEVDHKKSKTFKYIRRCSAFSKNTRKNTNTSEANRRHSNMPDIQTHDCIVRYINVLEVFRRRTKKHERIRTSSKTHWFRPNAPSDYIRTGSMMNECVRGYTNTSELNRRYTETSEMLRNYPKINFSSLEANTVNL